MPLRIPTMHLSALVILGVCSVGPFLGTPTSVSGWALERLPYCAIRPGEQCCLGRNDRCTMPIHDTLCYCDIFCNRTQTDCCPDFLPVCMGIQRITWTTTTIRPRPPILDKCVHEGIHYFPGQLVKVNCNNCTCEKSALSYEYQLVCTERPCVIQPNVVQHVNIGDYGWRASNYSFLWGMTLDEGVRYRLGTISPPSVVKEMTSLRVQSTDHLPETFDWREEAPRNVGPIMDQGDCGASWAFSSASVASDRIAVQSEGRLRPTLSPQQVVSCNRDFAQHGCQGGQVDRAWNYLWKVGVVDDSCYPYMSRLTRTAGDCLIARSALRHGSTVKCPSNSYQSSPLYQASPPYRIAPNEREIMKEILENGPAQATMKVKRDFYSYNSGVYRHSMPADTQPPNELSVGYHAVKIVGWGVDYIQGQTLKYWICANVWGRQWGEDGYFRILRGTNECDIESFVVGIWVKVNGRTLMARRHSRSSKPDSSV